MVPAALDGGSAAETGEWVESLRAVIHHSGPTRAQASDVASAALDGADGLMLSAGTSIGDHPLTAVQTMARIAALTEEEALALARAPALGHAATTPEQAVAAAAAEMGRALAVFTQTGASAFVTPPADQTDETLAQVDQTALGLGRPAPGKRVVVIAGQPGRTGSTNAVLVHGLASR